MFWVPSFLVVYNAYVEFWNFHTLTKFEGLRFMPFWKSEILEQVDHLVVYTKVFLEDRESEHATNSTWPALHPSKRIQACAIQVRKKYKCYLALLVHKGIVQKTRFANRISNRNCIDNPPVPIWLSRYALD